MINILFCGNKGVFDGVLTCILSILKRTKTEEPFAFYLFTMDVSHLNPKYVCIDDEQIEFLSGIVKQYNAQNQVKKIDITELYMREFDGCPNEGAYCSPYTLIRLFADEVQELSSVSKLLYLDCDIMFNRDIRLLWDVDVSDVEYAAARDHYGKYFCSPNFVNAGVLLFNMDEVKKSGLLEKSRMWIRRKKLIFADQSALRKATTKKKMLPQRFNDQKFLHKHTVVRHFSKRLFWLPYPHTANIKQWQVTAVHKKFGYEVFDDILYEYIYLKTLFQKHSEENQ